VDKKAPGVVEVLTGNRRMILGLVSFLLALLLAFSAIHRRSDSFQRKGELVPGTMVGVKKRASNDTGTLTVILSGASEEDRAKLILLDEKERELSSESLIPEEETELDIGTKVSYFKLVGGSSEASYEYQVDFTYQPWRSLAIPAGLLTIFGVIAVFKGFSQYMSEFAERQARESVDDGKYEEEGAHVDFMGTGGGTEDEER